jgi:hypothetical protein
MPRALGLQRAMLPGLLLAVLLVTGCASGPPREPDDLCAIFREKPDWHEAAQDSEKRWGAPLGIPMAFLYQESGFRAKARPPMHWFLGFIPVGRGSSAYGFSQAQTPAWKEYQQESGNGWSDRDEFADAMDFVQWYIDKTQRLNRVSKTDAYDQYLNYHEGWGGYRRSSYRGKPQLVALARKVETRAARYQKQYAGCREELQRGWFERLFD